MRNFINIEGSNFSPNQSITNFLNEMFSIDENLKSFFTGSRAYGVPNSESDWDFVFLDRCIAGKATSSSATCSMLNLLSKYRTVNDDNCNKISADLYHHICYIIKRVCNEDSFNHDSDNVRKRIERIKESMDYRLGNLTSLISNCITDKDSYLFFTGDNKNMFNKGRMNFINQYAGTRTNLKIRYENETINLIGLDEYEFHMWCTITEHICAIKDFIKPGGHKEIFKDLKSRFKVEMKHVYKASVAQIRSAADSL